MTTIDVLISLDGSEFGRQVLPYIRRLLAPTDHQLSLLRVAEEPNCKILSAEVGHE